MRAHWFLFPVVALASACGDSGTDPIGVPANAIAVETAPAVDPFHHFRWNSGIETRERLVIRDAPSWTALWERMNTATGVGPALVPPAVDFGRDMVIVATMGLRHTGGYRIIIESVHRAGNDLYVVVNERGHARCLVTQALTEPLDGVVVPRHEGEVIFVERKSVHVCGP